MRSRSTLARTFEEFAFRLGVAIGAAIAAQADANGTVVPLRRRELRPGSLPERALHLLASQPNRTFGPQEIANELGISPTATSVILRRLAERGLALHLERGVFQATAKYRQEAA